MDFKSDSLDWALEHALSLGDTDIFPTPFEYEAIKGHWKAQGGVRQWMLEQDPSLWATRTHRRCLVPKHRFGFRISTQLDPLDFLAFSSLVHDLGKDIEKARVPPSQNVVHSYRFKPDASGQLYDSAYGWNTFVTESRRLASSGGYEYVVLADIADFFPKLYAHPLENELIACTGQRKSTANAVLGFLKQWNHTISYGVPVGPAASRLLAELALSMIDKALLNKGANYCRFSDDFRIFCKTSRDAHVLLAFLAQRLFDGLGVTLQQHKTRIVTVKEFKRTLLSPSRQARLRLSGQFSDLLASLGIKNPYKKIDYDHLSPEKKAQVDALNLGEILSEQIELGDDLDIPVTTFVLRRLAQLEDDEHAEAVLGSLDVLYPVFPDAVGYLASLRSLHGNRKRSIGKKLLEALDSTVSGHLEFHRCWVLNVFAKSDEWDNETLLADLESRWSDVFTRRELILARGKAGHADWFKSEKVNSGNLGPWERRAFLYAASCLPGDEARHWWDNLKRRPDTDVLDKAIMAYARSTPIR